MVGIFEPNTPFKVVNHAINFIIKLSIGAGATGRGHGSGMNYGFSVKIEDTTYPSLNGKHIRVHQSVL